MGAGIVTKVNGNQLIVLLNEGLEIPMHRQDVVEVTGHQEEKQMTKEEPGKPAMLRSPSRMFFVKEGVFLAGLPTSAMLAEYSLVNHTDYQVFIVIYQLGRPVNKFFNHFEMAPKSVLNLSEAFPMQESNHWIGLAFQIVKFHPDQGDPCPIKEYRLAFSQVNWKSQQAKIPLMEKSGLLIQLDDDQVKVDPVKLKEEMMSHRPAKPDLKSVPVRRIESREVDLHIEALREDASELSAAEIMQVQLDAFESAFDKAIADSVENLILIHGVGSGVLRNEIHRRLGTKKQIAHFKDAQKDRFGYGATEVKFL